MGTMIDLPTAFLTLPAPGEKTSRTLAKKVRLIAVKELLTLSAGSLGSRAQAGWMSIQSVVQRGLRGDAQAVINAVGHPDILPGLLSMASSLRTPETILPTLVPSLQSRDVNPWYCHMISAWGLARWRLQSLTLRAKRSNLGKTMQFLHRAEFSEDRHDKHLLHVPAFVPPESDRVLESTSSSDSDKRMSQTSLSSPLRPPTGEIQAPPPLKREHGRQKHFLAPDPSPPDTDSRGSVSGNSNASLASPAGALSPASRPRPPVLHPFHHHHHP